ncbi:MAG: PLP-dependent aspartate aminotransferase family protein [Planctomycetota bacterium]|jgi:cystathionine gamma-lyase|nr:PLP-dependent aspartate aminotransferase family protein [Planctomycetota bacterium]MDA1026075.1 PLP-dependent aspartate aminotransferase family protein [Planctomycetota bacterium]
MSTHDHASLHFDSRCIHGGQAVCAVTGAVMPPIYTSSTYAQESPGVHKGFEYSRSHNLTRYSFERALASLEGSGLSESDDASHGGFAFASGLAAAGTCLELLDAGGTVIAGDDLYGGTYRLLSSVRQRTQGLDVKYVDTTDPANVEAALATVDADAGPAMVWLETPTNPTLKVTDIAAVAAIATRHGALTVVDNTFATPALQRPLELGADIVLHSVTKYLGGHSDVVGGALVVGTPELAERVRFLQNSVGSIMGPFDAYLALRGVKTLALRMARHCETGMRIATWLESHPKVERVVYPGLPSHPHYDVAKRQMALDGIPAFGGMITIFLQGGLDESRRFLETVQMFALAESLGGVESLIEHPAIMTHASVPAEQRAALGISDSLVRLSVGIEHCDDLIADLERGLNAV